MEIIKKNGEEIIKKIREDLQRDFLEANPEYYTYIGVNINANSIDNNDTNDINDIISNNTKRLTTSNKANSGKTLASNSSAKKRQYLQKNTTLDITDVKDINNANKPDDSPNFGSKSDSPNFSSKSDSLNNSDASIGSIDNTTLDIINVKNNNTTTNTSISSSSMSSEYSDSTSYADNKPTWRDFSITYNTSIREVINYVNRLNLPLNHLISRLMNIFSHFGPKIKHFGLYVFLRGGNNQPANFYKYKINRECKGMLFKYNNGRLYNIVTPIKHLVQGTLSLINSFYTRSSIYEVIDGTTIYLYYDEEWQISTANLFGVKLDNETYILNKQVLKDCLGDLPEGLFKELTYTFIIRHPKIQPLAEKPDIYFHSAASKGKKVETNVHGIKRINVIPPIPIASINNMLCAPLDVKTPPKYRFGVILTSPSLGYSIIVPTKLFEFVDLNVYNHMHERILEVNMQNAYKISSSKEVIKKTFPAFADCFEVVDKKIRDIAEDIYYSFEAPGPKLSNSKVSNSKPSKQSLELGGLESVEEFPILSKQSNSKPSKQILKLEGLELENLEKHPNKDLEMIKNTMYPNIRASLIEDLDIKPGSIIDKNIIFGLLNSSKYGGYFEI